MASLLFGTAASYDNVAGNNMESPEDHLLGVRNTFFDVSDAPPLKQWYKDIRGVHSCPASECGDDRSMCGESEDAEPSVQTPEPSPRVFEKSSEPAPAKPPANAEKPMAKPMAESAEARTPLKSGASPYRPAPVTTPVCSTTYYAVPSAVPRVGTLGTSDLSAEYHRRVQAAQASRSRPQAQAQWTQQTPMSPMSPSHQSHQMSALSTHNLEVAQSAILGSEALPSIGSGAHATDECRPCAFFHKNRCVSGRTCLFCHICDAGEKKRRLRMQKVSSKRSQT